MASQQAERPGRGALFVVSAPSGTGKTTVVEQLLQQVAGLVLSRSYTSRPIRHGEVEGVDYNFVSRSAFLDLVDQRAFLEWADVFGNLYGTHAADTERELARGHDVMLVIDVQGARQVRRSGLDVVSIFLLPPSLDVLEERLRRRSLDSDEQIRRRLQVARDEVPSFVEYDYVVVNDEVGGCVERLRCIVSAERCRLRAMRSAAGVIARTFEREATSQTSGS